MIAALCLSFSSLFATDTMNMLSDSQLLEIQNEMFSSIRRENAKLSLICKSNGTLIERWQQLLQIILPIQINVLKPYDLGVGQTALTQFSEE